MIDGQTKIVGVIGNPVSHSLSPLMHNTVFEKMGLNYVYIPLHVPADYVSQIKLAMTTLSVQCANVTVPYKHTVMTLCDSLSPSSQKAQAVNAVVLENGKLFGHNTDGDGFILSLKHDLDLDVFKKKIAILGAGGSAKSIGISCLDAACDSIVVVNRSIDNASLLVDQFSQLYPQKCKVKALDDNDLDRTLHDMDIIIQTTSVGMNQPLDCPLKSFDWIQPRHVVYDIIYSPAQTRLLMEARNRQALTSNGLGMLAGQGVLSFDIFTGHTIDYTVFKHILDRQSSQ